MIGLLVVAGLLVVLADLALVSMFILRWERRAEQPATAADQPADARAGAVSSRPEPAN